jgi:Ni/Fe-hydrogenase subunit HybB-like protein
MVTLIVQWLGKRTLVPNKVLFQAGQIAGAILLLYLYMRFWDTTAGNYGYVPGRTEAFTTLSAGVFALTFWAWEIFLGGLFAAILLIRAQFRQSVLLLLVGGGLAAGGLIANRAHTTLLAFTEPLTESPAVTIPLVSHYTPAWTEWAVTFGVVAILTFLFSMGMRFLPSFQGTSQEEVEQETPVVAFPGTSMQASPKA